MLGAIIGFERELHRQPAGFRTHALVSLGAALFTIVSAYGFDGSSVDPTRIAVGGFSDGATYALSLGLINGDLFRRVAAFSPGFIVDGPPHGKPQFFISHGTADPILPIDQCSRTIVPSLRGRGYDVTFREFAGGHTVPADVAQEAMRWLARAGVPAH